MGQKQHKHVTLSKEKLGKRITLYATNTDSIAYDVFLKVDTKDFRRSSNRPIIKTIPANTKLKLLTMIQLTNTKGIYDATFIVNVVSYDMHIDKDHEALEFKIDRALKDRKVTIFTKNRCNICDTAIKILTKNNVTFTEYNIDNDSLNYLKVVKSLKQNKAVKSQIPMLKVGDLVYNNIITIDDFTNALRDAFK
ncbi:hypothetical protein MHTCC0001_11550 [Flavobacteriaceae bacterium MHTCC 0001]